MVTQTMTMPESAAAAPTLVRSEPSAAPKSKTKIARKKKSAPSFLDFVAKHQLRALRCNITINPKQLDDDGLPMKNTEQLSKHLYIKEGWKNAPLELIDELNAQRPGFTHVMVDLEHSPFMVVDVDHLKGDPRFDGKGYPYTRSTRGKKHYWFRRHPDDHHSTKIGDKKTKTDFLYSHVAEPINEKAEMVGDFEKMATFDFEQYLPPITKPKPPPPSPVSPPAASAPAPAPASIANSDAGQAIDHVRNIAGHLLDERSKWISFIAACANSGVPESVCLEVSSRSVKHRPGPDAKTIADIYSKGNWRAGMGTLCHLSKQSDPTQFHAIQSKWFWNDERETTLLTVIKQGFNDTAWANAFLDLNARYVGWTKMGDLTCYDDETGLWSLGKKAESMIRNKICDTLQNLLRHRITRETDAGKSAWLLHLCLKLGQQTRREAIFRVVRDLAHQKCNQFDIDRHPGTERWFAFKDCIYDADTDQRMPYFPEAYFSQRLHYDCPVTEPEHTALLRQCIGEIYPDEEERDLRLTTLAYALTGDTSWEIHINVNGSPGAGKSVLDHDLAGSAFGIYHADWPSNIFSLDFAGRRKKFFTAALSRPIRFATIEELSLRKLDEETFKTWTSGGALSIDKDYEVEALQSTSMVTCISLTNNPLDITNTKNITKHRIDALKRRIAFFSMRSRFVPAEQVQSERLAGTEHVFVQKPELKNQFAKDPAMHQAFAWIMMSQWRKMAANDWKKPNLSLLNERLDEHLLENTAVNPIHQWLREHYEPDAESWVSVESIVALNGDLTIPKPVMRDHVAQVFGRTIDENPMYDRIKKVGGARGAVHLRLKGGCKTHWDQ